MLSNIFLCQHYFGEQGENGDNKVSTNENNLYIDLGNLFRKCKIFFSSEHSNGMLGDFYHAGNPSDVE